MQPIYKIQVTSYIRVYIADHRCLHSCWSFIGGKRTYIHSRQRAEAASLTERVCLFITRFVTASSRLSASLGRYSFAKVKRCTLAGCVVGSLFVWLPAKLVVNVLCRLNAESDERKESLQVSHLPSRCIRTKTWNVPTCPSTSVGFFNYSINVKIVYPVQD